MMDNQYEIASDLVPEIPPKQFNEGGKHHYYVRIYLNGSAAALDQVLFVRYTLHPTFRNRYRIGKNRSTNFDVKIWTYGYFDIQANIIMKNGSTQDLRGYVRWPVPAGGPFDDEA